MAITDEELVNYQILKTPINQHLFCKFLEETLGKLKSNHEVLDTKFAFFFDNATPHQTKKVD